MNVDDTTLLLVLTAGILIGTFVLVYLAWWRRRKPKNSPEAVNAPIAQATSGSAHAETHVEIHPTAPIFLPDPQTVPSGGHAKRETRKAARPKKRGSREEVIFEDTVELGAGEYEPIFSDLNEGDVVKGIATETDKDLFNVYVLDEENYALFCNGEEYEVEFEDEGVGASRIMFQAERPDTYYVVFDCSGSRIGRSIEVRLKRVMMQ
ncbi:MAG: hypothetical protein WB789_04885 [Thermoplasmata archaeon]